MDATYSNTQDAPVSRGATGARLFLLALVVMVGALILNIALTYPSLEMLVRDVEVSTFRQAASRVADRMAHGLRFGKPFDRFVGAEELVSSVFETMPGQSSLIVWNTQGQVLYAHDKAWQGTQVDTELLDHVRAVSSSGDQFRGVLLGGEYHVTVPVRFDDQTIGYVTAAFIERRVQSWVTQFLVRNLMGVAVVGFVVAIALAGWLQVALLRSRERKELRRRVAVGMFLLVGGMQLVYSLFTAWEFQQVYVDAAETKAVRLASFLREDVEYLAYKGIPLERIFGMQRFLASSLGREREILSVTVEDAEGSELAGIQRDGKTGFLASLQEVIVSPWPLLAEVPIFRSWLSSYEQRRRIGTIRLELDRHYLGRQVARICLDLGTTLLVCLVFLGEVVFLVTIPLSFQSRDATRKTQESEGPHMFLRTAGFLFFLAHGMSFSFVTVFSRMLVQPFWGMSADVMAGMPITAEMTMATVSVILTGYWAERRGWKEPFFASMALGIVGYWLSGLSTGLFSFSVGRGVCGLAMGMLLMAAQSCVLQGRGRKGEGVAHLFAGVLAGELCGCAIGGMLAERMTFSSVFHVAAATLILVGIVSFVLSRSVHVVSGGRKLESATGPSLAAAVAFLRSPGILAVALMVAIPMSLVMVGALSYYLPLYLSGLNVAQSDIGRVLMLYGLSITYLTPSVARVVDNKPEHAWRFLAFAGILSAGGLLAFLALDGIAAAVVVVLGVGIGNSLGAPSGMHYLLRQRASQRLGTSKALSLFRTLERLGQMVGPMVFGVLVGLGGESGVMALGYVFLGCVIVFILAVLAGVGRDVSHD